MFDNGRVLEELSELGAGAAKLAATPLWAAPDEILPDLLRAAQRLERCAAALGAHVIAQLDARGIARAADRRGTASWLRAQGQLNPAAARALVALAAGLERHEQVDRAFSAGDLHAAQAAAIIAALDVVRDEDCASEAETFLVEAGARFEPAALTRLGDRVLQHVAPERAEAAEAEALRRQEARAWPRRGLKLSASLDGLVRIHGYLTTGDAAVVRAALDPLCTPQAAGGRSPAQMRADALTDVCRLALRTTTLPESGGEPPQVTVTMAYDPLTATIGRARLDGGESLSPETARRIACDARITPVVLGGRGEILDAGRSRRLATGVLRRALVVRDQCCAFPGCDRPPRWCTAHHIKHWSDGGPTDLDNLVLLCGHHHRLVHEGEWQVRLGADRRPDFIPPRHVDQERRPQRNLFHRRT